MPETLAKDPAGFGAHVPEDARTQERDEAGARAFADASVERATRVLHVRTYAFTEICD